jgi:hypothetical protein
MKFSNDQIAVGDGFTKVGSWSGTVYTVAAFFEPPGMPSHVRLVAQGERQSAGMLMSISAVLDPRFWRRVAVVAR